MKKTMMLIVATMMSLLAVAKVIVPVPIVASKPYTGEPQTADIPESELYLIDGNEERTDVGDYEICLLLNDSTGYAWEGTDDDFVILPFSITQATNEWTTAPAIADWTYGETASVPTGAAKFGVPRVRYTGTANDGTVFTDVASVSMAGSYTADFTVAGTDNYSGLATNVPFHIKIALIEGEGGGEGGVSLSAQGYEGTYDGNGHSITVAATGADFTVEYALSNVGPWTGVNPVFTNACDIQVWYRVSSDLYTTVIGSKKVTITQSVVEVPEIPSKTYTGELLKADVPDSSYYTVIGNNGGIAAATYSFMLRLTDAVNTKWATTDDEFVEVSFTIAKATIDVSGVEWNYTDPFVYDGAAHSVLISGLPEGVTVKVYSNNTASAAGNYHATATVESGANFAETSVPACDWMITAKSIAGASVALGDRLVHTGLPLTQSVAGVTTADGFLLTPSDYAVSGNMATDVGLYTLTVTGKGNFAGTTTAQYTIYSTTGSELKDQIGDIGDVVPGDNGGWKVVVTNDISGTTVELGDNLGAVTIDLSGKNIVGKSGSTGDAVSVAGGNGEPAIRIIASGASGDATVLTIIDSVPDDTDDVIGGKGGDGTPGGNGGAAIQVVSGTKAGVKINIGASVGVRGGDGGKDLSGNSRGGDGGAGVDGNVGTNEGTIAGGTGGDSDNGTPGDDGVAVEGEIEDNRGNAEKVGVAVPQIASKPYSGDVLHADVVETERYTVSGNTGWVKAGTYPVTLTLKDPLRYRWEGRPGESVTLDFSITRVTPEELLEEKFSGIGQVSSDGRGGSVLTLTNAVTEMIVIDDNLGAVTIDLKGRNLVGKAGAEGDAVNIPGGRGEPAIRIAASGETGDATVLTIIDSIPDDTDDVIGGKGGDGTPGGNGGAAIQVVGGTMSGVKINIGASVGVRGGDGGKDLSGNSRGGNGGAGIDGNVGTNDGSIAGGAGGTSENGRGGDGGAAVTGNVEVNNGSISGGEGGSSAHGRGGSGGQGVEGTIGGGAGPVTDGENGSEPTIIIVDGGKSGSLNEASVEVPYDGKGHGIKITVTEPAEGATVLYAREEAGPYSPVNPLFTNVVDHAAVWYTVSAEGYPAVTNWATVTILPSIKKRFRVTYEYNGGRGGPEYGEFDVATYYGAELPLPTRPGYIFCGWFENPDFSGKEIGRSTEVIASDLTLYAKWDRRRLWYTEMLFHVEDQTYWDGYVLDKRDAVCGSVQVKVAKPSKRTGVSKVTVTIQMLGEKKKVSLKGTTHNGELDLTAKDGRRLVAQLTADGLFGSFDGLTVDGARNVFKCRDVQSKAIAADMLKRWKNVFIAVVGGEDGFGGLSVSVGSKGTVKITGSLATGEKVSAKAQLLVGERECAIAITWTKKKKTLGALVWLYGDNEVEMANLDDLSAEAVIGRQADGPYLSEGAVFRFDAARVTDAIGDDMVAEVLPVGMPVVQSGAKWVLPSVGKVKVKNGELICSGENLAALKLTYKIKDSTFKGSFKVYSLTNGKLKKINVTVQGVVMNGVGYGTATIKKPAVSFPITIE